MFVAGIQPAGLVYAVGGMDCGANCYSTPIEYLTSAEVYDLASGVWTALPPMRVGRRDVGVGVVDGVLYVVGGCGGNATTPYSECEPLDVVEVTHDDERASHPDLAAEQRRITNQPSPLRVAGRRACASCMYRRTIRRSAHGATRPRLRRRATASRSACTTARSSRSAGARVAESTRRRRRRAWSPTSMCSTRRTPTPPGSQSRRCLTRETDLSRSVRSALWVVRLCKEEVLRWGESIDRPTMARSHATQPHDVSSGLWLGLSRHEVGVAAVRYDARTDTHTYA